ncbi:MAG TPA: hypothetical protein VHZ56_13650 [Devosia sp.]|jgi:hypothetical protein|nr:hypothetical protein [Devosia sp.]
MRALLFLALLMSASAPALAQDDDSPPSQAPAPVTVSPAEGNWGCIALVDNTKAGLLTVYNGSYGYASATFGSPASGTGNAKMGSDGVEFLDGSITTVGIDKALVTFDASGNDILTVYTPDKPVLTCTPR